MNTIPRMVGVMPAPTIFAKTAGGLATSDEVFGHLKSGMSVEELKRLTAKRQHAEAAAAQAGQMPFPYTLADGEPVVAHHHRYRAGQHGHRCKHNHKHTSARALQPHHQAPMPVPAPSHSEPHMAFGTPGFSAAAMAPARNAFAVPAFARSVNASSTPQSAFNRAPARMAMPSGSQAPALDSGVSSHSLFTSWQHSAFAAAPVESEKALPFEQLPGLNLATLLARNDADVDMMERPRSSSTTAISDADEDMTKVMEETGLTGLI